MGAIDVGTGDRSAVEKRLSRIERLLSGLSKKWIGAKDVFGEATIFQSLTSPPIPDESPLPPFVLGRHKNGAAVGYGEAVFSATLIGFRKMYVGPTPVNEFAFSDVVGVIGSYPMANAETDREKNTELDWFGDVYVEWELTDEGAFQNVMFSGPEEPEGDPLPGLADALDSLVRESSTGKYWIKIGNVPDKGLILQNVTSVSHHVTIAITSGSG